MPVLAQPEPSGPVSISNQYPLSALHQSLAPESAETLASGQLQVNLLGSWANTSVLEDNYIVDGEGGDLTGRFAYGVGHSSELQLRIPFLWRGAGSLDPFIDGWHRRFSLPRGDRDNLSDKQYEISGENTDGSDFGLDRRGSGLGNIEVAAKARVAGEGNPVSYRLGLSLPTAEREFGHNGLDISNTLLYQVRLGRLNFYFGAAHLFLSDREIAGMKYRPNHLEGFGYLEYQAASAASLLCGISGATQVVRQIVGHPSYSVYLDLGARIYLKENSSIEMIIRENPTPGYGTTDVSFHLSLTSSFH